MDLYPLSTSETDTIEAHHTFEVVANVSLSADTTWIGLLQPDPQHPNVTLHNTSATYYLFLEPRHVDADPEQQFDLDTIYVVPPLHTVRLLHDRTTWKVLSGLIPPALNTAHTTGAAGSLSTQGFRVLTFPTAAAASLSGLSNYADGQLVYILNTGNNTLTLIDEDTGETAAERFDLGGADFDLEPSRFTSLLYSSTLDRWTLPQVGGGSGASTERINFTFDGQGTILTPGSYISWIAPQHAGTITRWTMRAHDGGSVTCRVDLQKGTLASPPTGIGQSVCGGISYQMIITAANYATQSSLGTWDTAIAAGDVFRIEVMTATTATKLFGTIEYSIP